MAKEKKTKAVNQGELLKLLCEWTDLTQEAFAKKVGADKGKGRSRYWYIDAIKFEIIPMNDKYAICRAYSIPMEYFEGKYALPEQFQEVNETKADYSAVGQKLQAENEELRKKLIERDEKFINLQDDYIAALKELQELKLSANS